MTSLILAASGRAADTGAITAIHLTLIAVLMVVAIAVICWGAIQKRRRSISQSHAEERQAEMEAAAPAEAVPAETDPVAVPVAAPPVASEPSPSFGESIPLTRLKGLGPKAAALLVERGIADVSALARLSDQRAIELDADLGAFSGRLSKDRWVEQAKLLAAGDTASYEKQFGKLG